MNCEQGDTAYFKGCSDNRCPDCAPLRGHVMTCVALDTFISILAEEPMWIVDPPQVIPLGTMAAVQDKYLRPIRGREGQDETLSWKEVPKVANKQHTT